MFFLGVIVGLLFVLLLGAVYEEGLRDGRKKSDVEEKKFL